MLIMGGCGDDGRGRSSQSSGSERNVEAEVDEDGEKTLVTHTIWKNDKTI